MHSKLCCQMINIYWKALVCNNFLEFSKFWSDFNFDFIIYHLDGEIVNSKVAPPMDLSFYKVGLNYKIVLGLIGINIYWDTQKLITIETTAALFNRTAGLCGTLDQDPTNDFTSKDGTVHKVHCKNYSLQHPSNAMFIKTCFFLSLNRRLQPLLMLGEYKTHAIMKSVMMKD